METLKKLKRGRPRKEEPKKDEEEKKLRLRTYNRTYYQEVEKFKDKTFLCSGCGRQVNKGHYEKHLLTKYHINHLKNL
jgi:hypothetical protein